MEPSLQGEVGSKGREARSGATRLSAIRRGRGGENLRRLAMANYRILTASEIESELKSLKDWSVKGGNIEAAFEFKDFRDAISFIVQIAIEAEVMNHHPEFSNSWNKVSFSFCTHDAGHKITDLDTKIAAKISATAKRFLSMA
jgi:4a-hydroxytetrahydrobiopterin dehydratase